MGWLAAGALLASSGAPAAEPYQLRGDAALGVDLYHIDSPWDDDDVSSFFDQYQYVRGKDRDVPFFVDLRHLDVGLFRDDDTSLVRLERTSPWAWNDRAELEIDWERLRLDLDYHRFRTDALRVFPTGTCDPDDPNLCPLFPALGTIFNPDVPDGAIFDDDHRLFDQRLGVGGDLRLRLDDLESSLPWLTELRLHSRFGRHQGETQDRFLLHPDEEPVEFDDQQELFRGNRRQLDQRVSSWGGGFVVSPSAHLTGAIDASYERFRENASEVTFGDLTGFTRGSCLGCESRGFQFVPDTDRFSSDAKLAGRVGAATLEMGAFYTHLDQSGSGSRFQQDADLSDTEVDTWSLQGAFDLPFGEVMGINGFAKYQRRSYDTVDEAFLALNPTQGQVDASYEKRRELDAGLELTVQPLPGTSLALGYVFEGIDRDLDFPDTQFAILPDYNLLNDEARSHTVYARARSRIFRHLHLSGEIGFMSASEVSYPRDLERALSGKARVSYALPRPVPLSLTVFGDFVDGENDDVSLRAVTSRSKDFERTEWSYGATVTAIPAADLVLFSTFTQSRDEEEFDHLRSNVPRFFGPRGLAFYTDSSPLYKSNVSSLAAGGSYPLAPKLELSLTSSVTWVRLDYHGSGDTSTAGVLDGTNDLRSRISSLDVRLDYTLRPGLRLGLGYRYDDYHHDHQHEPERRPGYDRPGFDDTRQTVMVDISVDLALFAR